jgi:hypothetical protein
MCYLATGKRGKDEINKGKRKLTYLQQLCVIDENK